LTTPIFAALNRGIEEDYRERLWFEEEPSPDEAETMLEEPIGSEEEMEDEESDEYSA
jgi:hypothetical protein